MATATTPNTDTEGGTMDTLTTPKHTPGPWTYDAEENGAWIYSADDREIAFLSTDERDNLEPIPGVEIRANAALIATAPDLLAACNAALAYLDAEDSAGLVAEIAAAVAKAEGRTL